MTRKSPRAADLAREIARLNCAISRLNRMLVDAIDHAQFEAERAEIANAEVSRLTRAINVLATVWDGTRGPDCIIAQVAFAELAKAKGGQ